MLIGSEGTSLEPSHCSAHRSEGRAAFHSLKPEMGGAAFKDRLMGKPAQIDIVRRAYQLWQQAGEPEGKDQEFYLQAERELQEAQARGDPTKDGPDDS
jgi:hypothetical protein